MNCLNCKKETSNPKYCSKSCAARQNNKMYPKRKTSKKCARCENKTRDYRTTLCEKHFIEYKQACSDYFKNKTVGFYKSKKCLEKLHKSSVHAHVRGLCRTWLKHFQKEPCRFCGYKLHVELCHIKPISSFPDEAILGEINSEKNVIPLCRNCHWEFDHGLKKV